MFEIYMNKVTFLSPGVFVSESTSKEIEAWDTEIAHAMSSDVVERYGARPYAFYFSRVVTAPAVPDGRGGFLRVEEKEVARSGLYFIQGTVLTMADVERRADHRDRVLLLNMRQHCPVVCETSNGFLHVAPFGERDAVVDATGKVGARGDAPEYIAYRESARAGEAAPA